MNLYNSHILLVNNTFDPPYIFRQGASKNSFQFCAGVVINKIQILSAAHCFEGMPKSNVIIISNMNEPQKTGDPKDWGYPWFKIKDVKIHEDHGRNKAFKIVSTVGSKEMLCTVI